MVTVVVVVVAAVVVGMADDGFVKAECRDWRDVRRDGISSSEETEIAASFCKCLALCNTVVVERVGGGGGGADGSGIGVGGGD
eukprot:3287802-Pleurochrysis_carterae.AAC.1